jgi:hypothetical protein
MPHVVPAPAPVHVERAGAPVLTGAPVTAAQVPTFDGRLHALH